MSGKLYIVATPIGNLKDMTFRAVEILKTCALILAEDTRQTHKLLSAYTIETSAVSYHKFNEKSRVAEIIALLSDGKDIALVSDAGTPLISDPGHIIVKECLEAGFETEAIPGASSALAALVISGFNPTKFMFVGFLSKKENEQKTQLEALRTFENPVIIFEAPARVKKTLAVIKQSFGDIPVAVVKELTKIYETVFRGKISEIIKNIKEEQLKGEFIIILGPQRGEAVENEKKPVALRIQELLNTGIKSNEAAKIIAVEYGLKKSDAYRMITEVSPGKK